MEEEFFETSLSYHVEDINDVELRQLLMNYSSTERIKPLNLPPQFEIVFKFSCSETHSEWITTRYSVSPRFLRSTRTPRVVKSMIRLDLGTFFIRKRSLGIIWRELERWVQSHIWRVNLSLLAFCRAVKGIVSMPQSTNVVFIDLNVVADHERVFHEERWLDYVARTSIQENSNMVPATDSSIDSLEKRIASSDGMCAICAEEYSSGFEATSMPCMHLFHEGCIKEWLRVSHYCPVCRFEMPV